MKNLKVLILALFSAVVGFTSCENLGLSPSESTDDSAYADFMFLATADSSGTGGKHGHGKKHNMTVIEAAALPAIVTSYISTNYVGSTIKRAAQSDSGKYAVHIVLTDSTHKGLLFDAAGVFVKEVSGKGHGGEKIDVATLPASITTYISTTYAGSTVSSARKSSDGKYGVVVTKADGSKVMLGFDAAGVFLNELTMKEKGGKGKGKGKGK